MITRIALSSQLPEWHAQITRLHNQVFDRQDSYPDICGCFEDPVWILVSDWGVLVGMVALGKVPSGLFVYNLAVDPHYRRTGIAKQIAEHALTFQVPLLGRVAEDNHPARTLYQRLGASITETKDGFVYYRRDPENI